MSRLNIANSIQCLTASRVSKSLGLPVFETRPLFFFTDNKAAEVLTEFESHTKIFLMTTGHFQRFLGQPKTSILIQTMICSLP